jgi:hypothetical protein
MEQSKEGQPSCCVSRYFGSVRDANYTPPRDRTSENIVTRIQLMRVMCFFGEFLKKRTPLFMEGWGYILAMLKNFITGINCLGNDARTLDLIIIL